MIICKHFGHLKLVALAGAIAASSLIAHASTLPYTPDDSSTGASAFTDSPTTDVAPTDPVFVAPGDPATPDLSQDTSGTDFISEVDVYPEAGSFAYDISGGSFLSAPGITAEPSSLLLLGTGILVLAAVARRRSSGGASSAAGLSA